MIPRFAQPFYNSKEWKRCRTEFVKSKKGLCERCLEKGRYNAGEIVHHKIPITRKNIENPEILLNWDNLQLLCRQCHGEVHHRDKRYRFDEYGHVILRDTPPDWNS